MSRFALLMIALSIAMTVAVGCSGIGQIFERHEAGLELVVRATAGRILTANPLWVAPTVLITAEALALLDDDPLVSLADLEQSVVARVDWTQLTPEEQALLRTLISGVRQDLEEHFRQQGISDPSATAVHAAQVLNWINQSAAMRLPRLGKGSSLKVATGGIASRLTPHPSRALHPWSGGCGA